MTAPPSLLSPSALAPSDPIGLLPPAFLPHVERVGGEEIGIGEGKLRLKGMALQDLEALLAHLGYTQGEESGAGAVARRLFRWIYHKVKKVVGVRDVCMTGCRPPHNRMLHVGLIIDPTETSGPHDRFAGGGRGGERGVQTPQAPGGGFGPVRVCMLGHVTARLCRSIPKLTGCALQSLSRVATLDGGLRLAAVKVAGDGTRKLVLEVTSGPGTCAHN